MRQNIDVALQYIESWLRGVGAVAIYNLMEDTATAEISRAQLWQWVHSPNGKLDDGRKINLELFRSMMDEELEKIKKLYGDKAFTTGKFEEAKLLLDQLVSAKDFPEFLTLAAYQSF